jgi:hypothetical protein
MLTGFINKHHKSSDSKINKKLTVYREIYLNIFNRINEVGETSLNPIFVLGMISLIHKQDLDILR